MEKGIGRMRRFLPRNRFLPRKTDLAELSGARLTQLIRAGNNTPRKCLGCRTPAEIYSNHFSNQALHLTNQALHLKCESTFPLSRE